MIDVSTACYILPLFNKLNHAPEVTDACWG